MNSSNIQPATITNKDLIQQLLEHPKIPDSAWDTITIEYLLSYLSSMDSNNFISKASVGEREGRCFSDLVARRNFYFTHGIGRSGDLTEAQPKAAGSSILYKITNILLNDLMSIYNIDLKCLLIPVPIGVSLMLCVSTFRLLRKSSQYVIWFREDNEVVFNAIINAGFIPIILSNMDNTGYYTNNILQLQMEIEKILPDKVTCVISSTTCLIPRKSDDIIKISNICKNNEIPHIVINDSGLQNRNIINEIKEAQQNGRIDVCLQNAGENFLIPVGSTLVASCSTETIKNIAKTYPGRASSSSVIDIFIALLSLGRNGYVKLIDDKEYQLHYLHEHLIKLTDKHKKYIVDVTYNCMSIALILSDNIKDLSKFKEIIEDNSYSIKTNFVTSIEDKILSNHKFEGWGTHGVVNYQVPFITFHLPFGTTLEEIKNLVRSLGTYLSNL